MEPPAETAPDGARLEPALEALTAHLVAADKALKGATQALKKARDAARTGNLRELERLLSAAARSAEAYVQEIQRVESSWEFSGDDYLSSREYLDELRAIALELGVRGVHVVDGRLYSYPHIVRVEPRDLAVPVGKKKHAGLRPSHLASMLKAAQARPEQGNLGAVLQAVEQAYLHLTNGELGEAIQLGRIHALLTLLPGSAKWCVPEIPGPVLGGRR